MEVLGVARHFIEAGDLRHGYVVNRGQRSPPVLAVFGREYGLEFALDVPGAVGVELDGDEVFPVQRLAQRRPEPRLDAPDAEIAPVAALIDVVVRRGAVQAHHARSRNYAVGEVAGQHRGHHVGDAVGHGYVNVLAPARVSARDYGGENRGRGVKSAAREVGDYVVRNDGRAAGRPYDAQRAADGYVVYVVTDQAGVRPVLPVARQRAIDEARVEFAQGFVVAAEPRDDAGPESFDEHVGVGDQFAQDLPRRVVLEIERYAALVAVQRVERGAAPGFALVHLVGSLARHPSAAGFLDADYVRAQVSQNHRAERAGGHPGQVNDFYSLQRGWWHGDAPFLAVRRFRGRRGRLDPPPLRRPVRESRSVIRRCAALSAPGAS